MSLSQISMFVGVDYFGTSMMRSLLSQWATKGSAKSLGSFESWYGVGQIIGSLILPYSSDSQGRRKVLQLSCFGTALGYGTVAFAVGGANLPLLLFGRLVTGLTKQTLTMARAIVGDVQAPAQRQAGMAVLTWVSSVGYLVGPLVGGWLADAMGISMPMYLITLLFLGLTAVSARLPETAPAVVHSKGKAVPVGSWRWLLAWKHLCVLLAIVFLEMALTGWTSVARPRVTKKILPGGYSSTTVYDSWLSVCVLLGSELWRRWKGVGTSFMIASNVVFAIGLVMLLRTTSKSVLYLSAPLLGVGISAARTLPAAILIGIAPDSSRGAVMGILDILGSFCRILAPLLTGQIIDSFNDDASLVLLASLLMLSVPLLTGSSRTVPVILAFLLICIILAVALSTQTEAV